MEIIHLDEQDRAEYEEFVASHEGSSFLQSWSWGDFQGSVGKKPIRIGVKLSGKLVGTAQFLKYKAPYLGGFYLYCPYGPLLTGHTSAVLDSLLNYIQNTHPEAKFVRLEPKTWLPDIGLEVSRTQPGKTLVTNLLRTPEELLEQMHPKTRYNIKVAGKHKVSITCQTALDGEGKLEIADAVALLVKTSSRQGYRGHGKNYYENLLNFYLVGQADGDAKAALYSAWYENRLAACAIMMDHGDTRTYLFGGSDNELRRVMAPYAMHWQAMLDAKQSGKKHYDWWGVETSSGATPGFVEFKQKFGGESVSYPTPQDIPMNKPWYNLYTVLRKLGRMF